MAVLETNLVGELQFWEVREGGEFSTAVSRKVS